MPTPLAIEYRPLDALIPFARNARTHPDTQIARIASSIVEFGFNNPILVDGENGIVAGHGRLLAARKLGLASVSVIELAHLSATQKRAYILNDANPPSDGADDEDIPEAPAEPITRLGDLWILGEHRLICADALFLA